MRAATVLFSAGVSALVALSGCSLFPSSTTFPAGERPLQLEFGDFDGNGTADAILITGSDELSLLLGNGSGGFGPARRFSTAMPERFEPTFARAIAVGDLNGDGNLDVAAIFPFVDADGVQRAGDGNLRVLLGDGAGGLILDRSSPVGVDPVGIAVGHLDGDGVLDIVVTNAGVIGRTRTQGSLSVLFGVGDGSFIEMRRPEEGRAPRSIALVDLNRDSQLDIAFTDSPVSDGRLIILRGDGAGNFEEIGVHPVGPQPVEVRYADLNRDGNLDLLTVNRRQDSEDPDVSVLLGRGDATFSQALPIFKGVLPADGRVPVPDLLSVEVRDVDQDGRPDLIGSNGSALAVLRGRGDGTFSTPSRVFDSGLQATAFTGFLVLEDLDGDGAVDATIAGRRGVDGPGAISVIRGRPNGIFKAQILSLTHPTVVNVVPNELASADFDGDSQTDIALVDQSLGIVSVLPGQGDGTFAFPITVGGRRNFDLGAGDFDGDGRADLVTTSGTQGGFVSVIRSIGLGSFAAPVTFPTGPFPSSLAVADLNLDGNLDVVTANEDGLGVLLGSGDGSFAAPQVVSVGGRPGRLIVGDLDRDGVPDVAGCRRGGIAFAALGRGDGTFADASVIATDGCIRLAAGDLTGNGVSDLVTVAGDPNRLEEARVLIGRGDGTFEDGVALQVAPGDVPRGVVIARLDANPSLDIAIANLGRNQISIYHNDGTGAFVSRSVVRVGDEPFALLAEDLDRGGANDLIVGELGGSTLDPLIRTLIQLSE